MRALTLFIMGLALVGATSDRAVRDLEFSDGTLPDIILPELQQQQQKQHQQHLDHQEDDYVGRARRDAPDFENSKVFYFTYIQGVALHFFSCEFIYYVKTVEGVIISLHY